MTDALHERAELLLLGELTRARRERSRPDDASSPWPKTDPRQLVAQFACSVDTLRAIGALDDRAAAAWRERFADAIRDPAPKPTADAAVSEPVRRQLEQLIDTSARQRATAVMSPFEHALAMLRDGRLIAMAEFDRWYERFVSHPELPDDTRDALRTRLQQPPEFSGRRLQRVLAGPTAIGDTTIGHVELYADGLKLFWQRPATKPTATDSTEARRTPAQAPQISDDIGTPYQSPRASADGTPRARPAPVVFESRSIRPASPPMPGTS